jgi:ubiquitin-like-conjugating enzyme ATG10
MRIFSCNADGSELTWDALVDDLPAAQRTLARSQRDRWSFLTRQDHPHLQRPWYTLHPCQTAALLALLLARTTAEAASGGERGDERGAPQQTEDGDDGLLLRYMLAWCSVVPAALGLTLPAQVYTSQFQRAVLDSVAVAEHT